MKTATQLQHDYNEIRSTAERLAGNLQDLAQRAAVYHHVYEHSSGNHTFPLIAAHGALWANSYFSFGMKLGRICSWQYPFSHERRQTRLKQLAQYADRFREINRQVCIDTYTTYYFTLQHGGHPLADRFVPNDLLQSLMTVHQARLSAEDLTRGEKREVFRTFFLNEQATVVGPRVTQAVDEFNWKLMRTLSLRPIVRFKFFCRPFFFGNFARVEERIQKGLRAFDIAADLGWKKVESTLASYNVLPDAFFRNARAHFATISET